MVLEWLEKRFYGVKVLPKDDSYISISEKAVRAVSVAAGPGNFLVDTFPCLKYVPDWMPLAGFEQKAKEWRKSSMAMIDSDEPLEVGKRKFVSTTVFYHLALLHQYFNVAGTQ